MITSTDSLSSAQTFNTMEFPTRGAVSLKMEFWELISAVVYHQAAKNVMWTSKLQTFSRIKGLGLSVHKTISINEMRRHFSEVNLFTTIKNIIILSSIDVFELFI